MKRLKQFALGILGTAFLSVGLFACSNDEEIHTANNTNSEVMMQTMAITSNSNGLRYAAGFYNTRITEGQTIEIKNPDNLIEGVKITELIVDNYTKARGYIVNDLENNNFLYFVDVDRTKDEMTTYEVSTQKTEKFTDLINNVEYINSDKFDFINIDYSKTTYGSGCGFWKKLWGDCTTVHPIREVTGSDLCTQTTTTVTYRLFQKVDTKNTFEVKPCNEFE